MSIAARASLAVGLMAGFYLLATGIAAGLLFIPYAEMMYAERLHGRLAVFCVVGAGVILWSIVPRPDRFTPPGPRLEESAHPRLFAMLRSVAGASRQEMPAEVFLVPEVNAWVAQRGGVMGIGSRRVMGLGLPLLQTLTVTQLQAVLAHEFGHYYGGDTKLGPWVYKTRAAIGRTLQNLSQHSSALQKPFLWYGNMFLRVSMAVSRNQELTADRMAAEQFGAAALGTGLQSIAGAAMAYDAYWREEAAPVLSSGYRPPLAAGFERFLRASPVAAAVERGVSTAIESGKSNPYDTHPSLPERLKALGVEPGGAAVGAEEPRAISLLEDLPRAEQDLLLCFATPESVRSLEPIDWSDVGTKVYAPAWGRLVEEHAGLLRGVVPASIPDLVPAWLADRGRFRREDESTLSDDALRLRVGTLVGAALARLLLHRGWILRTEPGEDFSVEKEGRKVQPFTLAQGLVSGDTTPESWSRDCAELGIADSPMVAVQPGA